MKHPPTDLQLLQAIYEEHRDAYNRTASTGPTVPIDYEAVVRRLEINAQSVYGRLYYSLNPRYEARYEDAPRKERFTARLDAPDVINFPLLEAPLADHWQEDRRASWSLRVSLASVGVSS